MYTAICFLMCMSKRKITGSAIYPQACTTDKPTSWSCAWVHHEHVYQWCSFPDVKSLYNTVIVLKYVITWTHVYEYGDAKL